jgi:hypothetical protein
MEYIICVYNISYESNISFSISRHCYGKAKRCNIQRIILKNKKISMFLTVAGIDMITLGFQEVNVEKRHPAPGTLPFYNS